MPQVMFVDDEEYVRESVRDLLESEGIETVTATCASECLGFLHDGFRGLILLDVSMPQMDGWATIREMEHAGLLRGNVIAMLTGQHTPDERMEGLQEIVIDYITKPIDPPNFVESVRKYLTLLDQMSGVS